MSETHTPRPSSIELLGVREHNLKNLNLRIPLGKWTVITGLSGSGKSSLAFDTLYAEGQRRYIESLSTYTRQFLEKMPKPELDQAINLPPAIALEQRNTVMNSRSTVGTQTEVVDCLRIIYSRIAEVFCSQCGKKVEKLNVTAIHGEALKWFQGKRAAVLAPILEFSEKEKKKTRVLPVLETLQVHRARGLRRILWRKPKGVPLAIDLDDLGQASFPKIPETALKRGELWLVIDRLKLSAADAEDKETTGRVLDSLELAIELGQGKIAFFDLDQNEFKAFEIKEACQNCGKEAPTLEPGLFSFNSPMGACTTCSGFGFTLDLDEALVVPNPQKTLKDGAIDPLSKPSFKEWQDEFFDFCKKEGIPLTKKYSELTLAHRKKIWKGTGEKKTFPGVEGVFQDLAKRKYYLHIRVFIRRYQAQNLCLSCNGARLRQEALFVKLQGKSIAEVLGFPIEKALEWLDGLKLSETGLKTAFEPLNQLARRLVTLEAVGVGYLTLSRLTKTLSGGEMQRIQLATQLGTGLCGTLYILDEPSIGLHPADTEKLISVLRGLRNQGNTVVVVEHDLEVMRASDWLIELGPGAGKKGGEIVAAGELSRFMKEPDSLTAKYLRGDFQAKKPRTARNPPSKWIRVTGCRENNLKNLEANLPLERLVGITGVSGSGKSTLVHQTLSKTLERYLAKKKGENYSELVGRHDRLYGAEQISDLVLLDQSPIGKTSRSNPATYLKAWDEVRKIYSNQPLAIRRGFTPQHFSFNVDGGRCPICKGEGEITIDLHFMAAAQLPCEECDGKRFKRSVLEVKYRGKNAHELLETTIDEAYELLRDHPPIARKLGILREVGLGYLGLGQSGAVLSGGESQRLKIAKALEEQKRGATLYVFDEPTTGLHPEDVRKLMLVIQDLVDRKQSVWMIEHNLDVISQCDYVIDLGPGGGERGGEIIALGSPYELSRDEASITGQVLLKQGYFNSP